MICPLMSTHPTRTHTHTRTYTQKKIIKKSIKKRYDELRLSPRLTFRRIFANPSDLNSQLAAVYEYRVCCEQSIHNIDKGLVDERDWHMGSRNTSFCCVVALREICRIRSDHVITTDQNDNASTEDIPSVKLLDI